MKRSKINAAIRFAEELCQSHGITLPDFARYPADRAVFADPRRLSLVRTMLGWDVTDFGSDEFDRVGAVLFTVRNGLCDDPAVGTPYAEKYIFLRDGACQEIPMHYHITKTEDIINRAGGVFCCQVAMRDKDGAPDMTRSVRVLRDGEEYVAAPGEIIEIAVGDSITLEPYVYHRFFAKPGCGDLIIGEVSKINDDSSDNVFAEVRTYFRPIEEDEARYRLLGFEYDVK